MNKINVGRAILGGLVTGLILNIGEVVLNMFILAKEMQEFFRRCNFPEPGSNFIVIAVVITFVLGIVIVLVYAAIRPRFGPGPKTAIIAALFAWFCVYVYQNVIAMGLGMVPIKLVMIALGWGLVEYIVATLAGAALYKEA
jgi:hypothetical protein